MKRTLLALAGAATAVCIGYHAAQAAPATSSLEALKVLGSEQGTIEQARCWRRCWRTGGGMKCRRACRRIRRNM
jgi:hypothetical protein